MKVFEIQDSFSLESLKLVEKPRPEPGPGEVLLRMRAVSLNYRDLLVITGRYNPRMSLPRIPVSDGVGEVAALGDGVTRVQLGDRVAGTFVQSWLEGELTAEKTKSALGGEIDGMLTEFRVLQEDGLVHVPEHLSDEEAASFPCAAVTAWNAIVHHGRVKAGETVLLLGTGGVSIFALQFARLLGARVIITSSSEEKLGRALEMGASDGINYRLTPDWHKRVLELTGGVGVDHVIEVGGAGTLEKSLRSVRIGGRISLIGVLSGLGEVNPLPIIMRSIGVQGIFVGSRTMFEEMNRAVSWHQLRPAIDRIFPFEEAPQAIAYMESGAHFGKIAIHF